MAANEKTIFCWIVSRATKRPFFSSSSTPLHSGLDAHNICNYLVSFHRVFDHIFTLLPFTMTSTGTNGGQSQFFLTPQQQRLLFAALNSNKQPVNQPSQANSLSFSPHSLQTSPAQEHSLDSFQETPVFDNYDYDFGDSSFDFDFANETQQKLIGDLPGGKQPKSESPENDYPDKRAHPDDEEEANKNGASGAKRREGAAKVAKKPGRKPLTSEPSSVCFFPTLLSQCHNIPVPLLTDMSSTEAESPEPSCSTSFPRAQRKAPQRS